MDHEQWENAAVAEHRDYEEGRRFAPLRVILELNKELFSHMEIVVHVLVGVVQCLDVD